MATTTTASQRLKLALAPPPRRMQKSRPGKSNIAQAARASQSEPDADASERLSGEQAFGPPRRGAKVLAANEENIPKSSRAAQVDGKRSPSAGPTVPISHLKHLQSRAVANSRGKQPAWQSSSSALYSSQPQEHAIERRRRGATASVATARLTAATSLLQLNTTSASPNCQSATLAFRQQQQQQQQQIANQRRASSLAAEISFLKSRSSACGSARHLEALREGQTTGRDVANSRVSLAPQRARSVVALNTCAVGKSTTRSVKAGKPHSPAATCSSSARAALHQQQQQRLQRGQGAQVHRSKQLAVAQKPTPAVTNCRVRQGVLFARRQLHLTPVPANVPAPKAPRALVKTPPQVTKSSVLTSTRTTTTTTTTTTATTCRRQLTRLTRAQPRPLAAKEQAAVSPSDANKLAPAASRSTGHEVGSTRQRAHLLFESASRRARAGHSQHKKLSLDSSSSSSLDAPVAHIKRPRADPELAQSPEQLEKRRASLAAPGTGEQSYRRRWSSLESGSANEASSTPVSCSSLSSSSSSSCLVVAAVSPQDCAPVDTHEERSGRQRQRRHSSAAAAAATAATTGNRHAAADAAASVGAGRARQHVVDAAASPAVDPLANTREQQEKVPNANEDGRICDNRSAQQTNLDYSSNILINSSDTDNLFLPQRPKSLGQALIICSSPLTSNSDSNRRPGAATSDVLQNNHNNNNQCVCIVGRQPSSIENANCGDNHLIGECSHSKSLEHQLQRRQSIGNEDVSAPTRVADKAFSIKDKQQNNDQDDNEENKPMVLSTDEPQHYQSSQLERLETTLVASPPLLQLQQQQQPRRRRQSQSSSPMSCDLGEQGGQDENINLVAISPEGSKETTTTISEQPPNANNQGKRIGVPDERRASSNLAAEMPAAPAQLKAIKIDQIQNQEALPHAPIAAAGSAENDESSADESGPASKKHQPESIVAITQQSPIKINAKTDQQISICQEPISDIYDLETRPFARGKFAQVKRCVRRDTRQCFAAKCIKKRRRLVDIKHEILLEIEALKLSYETEYIVKLYEIYETPNEMILILEMANGGELQRVLDDEEAIEEPLVRKMIKQILEGLVHLHDNHIAHLDIKPQNLLLTEPFPNGDVKLCDFGISRRITKDCEIRDICGTPDYVAPEILRYDPISLATDMWSLGVLTYVLLSGYSPFGSENKQQTFCNITQANLDFPIEIFGKISEDAVDFIRKLIVREPSGRLTSRQARSHHWINQ